MGGGEHGRALVIDLHRLQPGRELPQLLDLPERQPRQEADSDAARVGELGALGQPVAVQTPA
jgi:hypothetical protein